VIFLKVCNTPHDYIKVTIGTNSIVINSVSVFGVVTLNVREYQHIIITGLNQVIIAIYVNRPKFSTNINTSIYSVDYEITLKTDVKYYDLHILSNEVKISNYVQYVNSIDIT
jgi:hypothetical protein